MLSKEGYKVNIDYDCLLKFAKENIDLINRPMKHKFRDRYTHTLRVLKWGERIQKIEGGDLEVVKAACILHDIGWDDFINHAVISRNISEKYLTDINYDEIRKVKVLEAIENHNNRYMQGGLNLESFIIMDADILDEVGAISIIWDAMAAACESDASYKKAYNRIVEYSDKIKERKILLKTAAGNKFYENRLKLIDSFIKELEFELED